MLFVLHVLYGCGGDSVYIPDKETLDFPITFCPRQDVEGNSFTRADASTPFARDFIVFGQKAFGNARQVVMNNYKVTHNAGDYNYVNPTLGQTVKYWDLSADEYRFWAYSEGATATGNAITIPLTLQKGGAADPDDMCYYSELYKRKPVTTDQVQLQFKRPYAKVCIIFYNAEPLAGEETTEITNISFAPADNTPIWKNGTLTITYPIMGDTQEALSVTCNTPVESNTQPSLQFNPVTLTASAGNSAPTAVTATVDDDSNVFYYVLPVGNQNPDFTLSLTIDDEDRTATIPAALMAWQPNLSYTYMFKVIGGNKGLLLDDVKIEPWGYGGSQDVENKNW